jgi:hypothetical protein
MSLLHQSTYPPSGGDHARAIHHHSSGHPPCVGVVRVQSDDGAALLPHERRPLLRALAAALYLLLPESRDVVGSLVDALG